MNAFLSCVTSASSTLAVNAWVVIHFTVSDALPNIAE
jgi:hypothetical protein